MVSKLQERIFAEEAAKLLDAQWEIVDISEPPDFEIRTAGETFGLEVRQIFIDSERPYGSHMKRDESKRLLNLRSIAQRYYEVGGEPIHVKVLGSLLNNNIDVVVRELVRCRPVYCGPESLLHDTELYIGGTKLFLKALPASFAGYSRWISINDHGGWVRDVQATDLQPAVDRPGGHPNSPICGYLKIPHS